MPAVRIGSVRAEGRPVFEDEGDLDDTCDTGTHQRISKNGVNCLAYVQRLRMGAHRPTRHEQNERRDEVALWPTIPLAAQKHPQKTSTPPHDAHRSMLQVVLDPSSAPSVLCEGVDTSPYRDDRGIKELLTAASPMKPKLPDQQEDRQ